VSLSPNCDSSAQGPDAEIAAGALAAIFAVLYPVALATTYLATRRAARVCPAEPLRFR